jgi:hypothetical protein
MFSLKDASLISVAGIFIQYAAISGFSHTLSDRIDFGTNVSQNGLMLTGCIYTLSLEEVFFITM